MGRALTSAFGGADTDAENGEISPLRRILLVGFMGSGKSTVGPKLAGSLGWSFVDADAAVTRSAGESISEIFRTRGEEAFRAMEHRIMSDLLGRDEVVIASGGGWPCRPGRLDAVPPGTLTIWLRAEAERILRRVRAGRTRRPLLEVDDPSARIEALLAEREPFYSLAQWSIDTGSLTPDEVVRRLSEHLPGDAGRRLEL